jgi:hypothetical protein
MKVRFTVIAFLVLILMVGEWFGVNAGPAIIVLNHAFAKNYVRTRNGNIALFNMTSTFTQDDPRVYSYVKASFYIANLTWNWYDPSGQIYEVTSFNASCDVSPCDNVVWLDVRGNAAATLIGQWRLDFLADGILIFSDNFWILATIRQNNYWNFTVSESPNPHIDGSLRVEIHPFNLTWSYYRLYMPYASNVTAHDYLTKQPLEVTTYSDGEVVVNLRQPRSDGYSFVLNFGLPYSLQPLGGGNYVMAWREYPWERYGDVHTVPETYNVTLPSQAMLLDVVGYNSMDLNYSVLGHTEKTISINDNVTDQNFGWSVLYRDLSAGSNANPSSTGQNTEQPLAYLPILPVTPTGLSAWSAAMALFLLTASELAPMYTRGGYRLLINRKRLRIAALVLLLIFVVTFAYQLASQQAIIQH